jgi:serine/threonine protein kinase
MQVAGECIAGRYRLEYPLGEGGMGSVWKAWHLGLDAPVAIKFQHAHRARSPGAAARFRREARAAAKLGSPHVVRVVDYGIDAEVPFIAMELLEGESLKTRLERQTVSSLEETVEFIRQAANALDAAHAAGIVHRDLKPSNLFVVKEGERESVKLLDFGIAKWFEADGEGITEDDLVVGSAQYMSPEQARGEAVDGRTDVWSLGVVAYQMLTGELPFQGANIPDTLRRLCTGKCDPLSFHLGPAYVPVDAVFGRAFEVDPELRFESAGAFARALSEAAAVLTPEARLADTFTSPSGWTFGREGATLSAPVPRAPRRGGKRRALVAVTLAVAPITLALVAFREEPADGPARTSQTATASPSASVAVAILTASTAMPSSLFAPPLGPTPPTSSAQPRRRTVAARRPAAESRSVLEAPPPKPPAPPSHVDPVFGLEVPAPR